MVFPATDPYDNVDQQTLRHVSLNVIRRIDRIRKGFLETCAERPHLADRTDEERRLAFGALLTGARLISSARIVPGADPGQFLASLSLHRRGSSHHGGIIGSLFGRHREKDRIELMDRLVPVLATWPAFDKAAFLDGYPQGDDFMAEFSADFAGLREAAFEVGKPLQTLAQLESHIDMLAPIYRSYERAIFAGIDPARLEEFLQEAAARIKEQEFEPEPAT